MDKTEQHKIAILEALSKSLGIVTSACERVGVGRTTFYSWLHSDPEFKKKVDDLSGIAIDYAETQLLKQMAKGNAASTIFFLKTKGRSRGYIEKQDFDVTTNGNEIQPLPQIITITGVLPNAEESNES